MLALQLAIITKTGVIKREREKERERERKRERERERDGDNKRSQVTYRFIGGIDGIVCVSIGSIHKLIVDEQLMWEAQFHVVLLHLHLINNSSHRSNKVYRKTNGQNTCKPSASHMHK